MPHDVTIDNDDTIMFDYCHLSPTRLMALYITGLLLWIPWHLNQWFFVCVLQCPTANHTRVTQLLHFRMVSLWAVGPYPPLHHQLTTRSSYSTTQANPSTLINHPPRHSSPAQAPPTRTQLLYLVHRSCPTGETLVTFLSIYFFLKLCTKAVTHSFQKLINCFVFLPF